MTSQARLVGGRYEEGEPLGRGGMADVRKGVDNRLGRTVAIKRLRVDLASDSTFQARFRREAQSAASLNHPTIVSVYDTGEEPDPNGSGITIPYIVMEYVAGKTLRDLIREGRKIMPERALEMTSGVLEALDYSHRAGIVHRDIKPGNVMLTPQGQVKVMDFGIARAVADTTSDMTQTAAVIGTAQYLSPEQARGETVDARSDLYSTGCLLYELLVGRPPFVGESPVSVAYQHVREEPAPPSSFDPDIPPEVDAVVLKALVKDREHRYQSAAEMRQDIHRVLAGQQVTAPMAAVADTRATTTMAPTATRVPPPPAHLEVLEVDDSRARRNRGLAFFLLGLAIVAAAIGAYALIDSLGDEKTTAGTPTQTPTQTPTTTPSRTPTAAAKVAVPTLKDLTVEQARVELAAKGLKVGKEERVDSATVAANLVISSDPASGAQLNRGDSVNLTISKGQSLFSVPNVIGKPEQEARQLLEKDKGGFKVAAELVQQNSDKAPGTVLSVSPDPKQKQPKGTEFTLTVSAGPGMVKVEDVTTVPRDAAEKRLQAQNLVVGFAEEESETAVEGTVVRQDPVGGSEVPRNSKVILYLAVKPNTPPTTPAETPGQ
jgi:serine/threonine-protein kinase